MSICGADRSHWQFVIFVIIPFNLRGIFQRAIQANSTTKVRGIRHELQDGDDHEMMAGMKTRPDYRMTRAPGTETAGDSKGDENEMDDKDMDKDTEEGEDANDGP